MNRFVKYVVELSEKHPLTLKINYSSKCGWSIQLHEKGYDVPTIDVKNHDKEKAFKEAYKQVKEYVKELNN